MNTKSENTSCGCPVGGSAGYPSTSPEELKRRIDSGEHVQIIDVRSPAEFETAHIPGARNIPLQTLSAESLAAEGLRDVPIAVACQGGSRSKQACELLAGAGFGKIVNVTGGTKGWRAAGLPTTIGAPSFSLERQVRIAAGSLAALGSLGALFLSPWFAALSLFVGCGLVFAGVTDKCGMALVLARAPWNNRTGGSCAVGANTSCCNM